MCDCVVGFTPPSSGTYHRYILMEEQLLEIDSIADLRVSLEDSVSSDAAVIVGGEVPPEQSEDVVGGAAGSRP